MSTAGMEKGSAWAGMVKAENKALPFHSPSQIKFSGNEDSIPLSLSFNNRGVKKFSVCQPPSKPGSTSGNAITSKKTFVDGLCQDISPDCVRSLLSSPPAEAHRELDFSQSMLQQPACPARSLLLNPNYPGIGMEGEAAETLFRYHASGTQNSQLQEMSRFGSDSSGEPHHTLSFSWD